MKPRSPSNSFLGLLTALAFACGGSPPPPTAPQAIAIAAAPTSAQPDLAAKAPLEVLPGESDAGVPVSPADPSWGSRTALVTIVEFGDFQCPYTRKVQEVVAHLRDTYGPDELRIVWKNNPLAFHPNARPAAEAAAGVFTLAGNDAFWRFYTQVFADQAHLGPDAYHAWAEQAGADPQAVDAGLERHDWAAKIDEDAALAKKLGSVGTPDFYVNGVHLMGAQPLEKFRTLVDQELEKARTRVAAGLARERVYAVLSRENFVAAAKSAPDVTEDTRTVFKVPLGSSPRRGPATALVTIIEFGDYQCPFTGRVQPTLAELLNRYKDQIRIVFKNEPLPFHPRAEPAAEAALEVRTVRGDAAFWRVHDALFANQRDLGDDVLERIVVAEGVSPAMLKHALQSHTFKRVLDDDADLSDDFQASGTPHFFINGRRLVGAQPVEKFSEIIDEEIQHAKTLLASGTAPAALYDALVAGGKGPPAPERKSASGIPGGDPARGPATAKVTVHEWGDFQCPFCGRVEPTLADLQKEFGAQVRWVWHDLPLPMHKDAPLAAQAGREAFAQRGAAAFWKIHDKMYGRQLALARADLDGYAQDLGLDLNRWAAALDGGGHDAELKADKDAADALGFSGTPVFLVVPRGASDGYVINGAQPAARFRKIVNRAMTEAK